MRADVIGYLQETEYPLQLGSLWFKGTHHVNHEVHPSCVQRIGQFDQVLRRAEMVIGLLHPSQLDMLIARSRSSLVISDAQYPNLIRNLSPTATKPLTMVSARTLSDRLNIRDHRRYPHYANS